MLKAAKDFSLGAEKLSRGDIITASMLEILPPRRIEQLKTQRFVEETTDEQIIEARLAGLTARIEKLEAKAPVKKKRVGRPKKAA